MRPFAPLRRLAILLVMLLTLPGCGIVFIADFDGTELMRELELDGDLTAGSELTVTVEVNDAYPVPIRIACAFENVDITDEQRKVAFHERATYIGERLLAPVPQGEPGDEVEKNVISFTFAAEEPGDFFVACFTPAAPENGIGHGFTIEE